MNAPRETLLVAGLSARLLAEAAARGGYDVIACDAYGDADTRAAARRWVPIGTSQRRIDAARLLAALADAAREPGVIGWVAGSDLEGAPELLAEGARVLPLIGTPPEAVRRVRDMRGFFAALDRLGLAHPETRFAPPDDAHGWLRKDAHGSGGWHIRRADVPVRAETAVRAEPVEAGPSTSSGRTGADPGRTDSALYWQREAPGTPMSALFLAASSGAQCIGVHELLVRPLGAHPHVYRGAVGPVALPAPLAQALQRALDQVTAEFGLRGLASLDFLGDGDALSLLEINPRPSASMALHAALPLMRAHVAACRAADAPSLAPSPPSPVRGSEIVFARHALTLSAPQAAMLAARGDCHDLPLPGSAFEPGDPVCSVEAEGRDAAAVRARLDAARRMLRDALAQT